jgi:hypothetical protein
MERPPVMLLAVLGLAAGCLSGFFGIGGGLVLVPALMILCRYPIKRAVGISMLTIIGVSLVAVLAEMRVKHTNIHWTMAVALTAGSLGGSLLGGRLLKRIPETSLRLTFAGCLVVVAYRMALGAHDDGSGLLSLTAAPLLGHLLAFPVGVVAGLTSTLFGLGGGVVTVPGLDLLFRDVSFHAARATSLVTIVPTSAVGGYQHQRAGTADVGTALRIMPTAIAGAILGVVCVNRLATAPCRIAFGVFLIATAIRVATLKRAGDRVGPSAAAIHRLRAAIPLPGRLGFASLGYAGAVMVVVVVVSIAALRFSPARGGDWLTDLARLDRALARGDVAAAVAAWHDANSGALGNRSWERLVLVGDAAVRIARRSPKDDEFVARARQAYLGALIRARRDGSLDGILRTAEAFMILGDRPVVEQSLQIAAWIAAADRSHPSVPRLHALEERLGARSTVLGAEEIAGF